MTCLETDRQLGSFTTPQLLPSYHNHRQALPQTAGFRACEERYLLLGTVSLKFRAKASWGSQTCFSLFSGSWQLSCSLFSIVPDKWAQVTFWGEWWLFQVFFSYQGCRGMGLALNAPTGCFTLGMSVAYCQIPPFLRPWHWHSLALLGSRVISIPFLVFHSDFPLSPPLLWTECVFLKFICWHLNLQLGICRWGHWEVIRSWGLSPHEWDYCPSKKRDDYSLHHVRMQQEGGCL